MTMGSPGTNSSIHRRVATPQDRPGTATALLQDTASPSAAVEPFSSSSSRIHHRSRAPGATSPTELLHEIDQLALDHMHLWGSDHHRASAMHPATTPTRQLSCPDGITITACRNNSIAKSTSSFDIEDCTDSPRHPTAKADQHACLLQQQYHDDADSLHVLRAAEQAVSARLLPPLLLLVMVSYIDRTNLSFASIQLSRDLNLSSTIYGLGSGAFFLAYACGQIPSNFLLLRYGGPAWLAVITVAWGCAASAFALVRGPVSFVLLRLILGLAESGAIPGVWYYVSLFYPANKTTLPYSLIETGITVSQVIAAPCAALLLMLDGAGGLRGWQWLFLLEGLPALLLGCAIRFWLPSSIATASFLTSRQKDVLSEAIAAAPAAKHTSLRPLTPRTAGAAAGSGQDLGLCHASSDELRVRILDGCTTGTNSVVSSLRSSPEPLQRPPGGHKLSPGSAGAAAVAPDGGEDSSSNTDGAPGVAEATASGAAVAAAGWSSRQMEQQSLLSSGAVHPADVHSVTHAPAGSTGRIPMLAIAGGHISVNGAGVDHPSHSRSSSGGSVSKGQALLAVMKNKVVLYAGCWRILHDIPGNGILYWTPKIVQALLVAAGGAAASSLAVAGAVTTPVSSSGTSASNHADAGISFSIAGNSSISPGSFSSSSSLQADLTSPTAPGASSPGVYVVLLSSIPYAAASLFHLLNAWHSQRNNENRWHIAVPWLGGAAALLILPAAAGGALAATSANEGGDVGPSIRTVSVSASVAAFAVLTLAHVGVNGANGVQTGLVSGCIVPAEKALGLALYNTIGNVGSFWGPLLIGLLHDATGGYAVAMWLLGASLAGAACMVARFRPEQLDSRLCTRAEQCSADM